MKKKTIGLLLSIMTAVSFTACGTKDKVVTEAVAMEVTEETGLIVEDAPMVIPETDKTIETEEPIYLDYEDLFLADNYLKVDREKLAAVDVDSLEKTYEDYVLSESVDLYNFEGRWVGYSKPNINVTLFGTTEDWAEVSFIRTILYIPRDRFDAIALAVEEPETKEILLAEAEEPVLEKETTPVQETTPVTETPKAETTKPKTETPKTETSKPVAEAPATEPIVEPEPVVIVSNKYTPEEAVAVYRSIMESNGIQWDPSIKEFASWGTGWIYLDKGEAERAGNSSVEAFRRGGGDSTHPWTKFYLEVTGSDENAVYITKWSCD